MDSRPPAARQILVAAVLLVSVTAIAALGSLATIPNTGGWYADVNRVPWNPPNQVFGPAWSILYLLIAGGGWLIWRAGWRAGRPNSAGATLTLYTVQLALNAAWAPVFFAGYPLMGESAWWIALAIIVALDACVLWLIVSAWKRSRVAALLLAPYLAWILFASTLNAGVIALN